PGPPSGRRGAICPGDRDRPRPTRILRPGDRPDGYGSAPHRAFRGYLPRRTERVPAAGAAAPGDDARPRGRVGGRGDRAGGCRGPAPRGGATGDDSPTARGRRAGRRRLPHARGSGTAPAPGTGSRGVVGGTHPQRGGRDPRRVVVAVGSHAHG